MLSKSEPNIETVQLFLENKADCNKEKGYERSAYKNAILKVVKNKFIIIKLLIESGAKIDTNLREGSANELHYLMCFTRSQEDYDRNECGQILKYFLEERSNNVNAMIKEKTPLSIFLASGCNKYKEYELPLLEVLLQAKADPNIALNDDDGSTPFVNFFFGLDKNCYVKDRLIDMLIDYKADPFIKRKDGMPVIPYIILTMDSISPENIKILITKGLFDPFSIVTKKKLRPFLKNFLFNDSFKQSRNVIAWALIEKSKKIYIRSVETLLLCLHVRQKKKELPRVPEFIFSTVIFGSLNDAFKEIETIKHEPFLIEHFIPIRFILKNLFTNIKD